MLSSTTCHGKYENSHAPITDIPFTSCIFEAERECCNDLAYRIRVNHVILRLEALGDRGHWYIYYDV